MRQIATTRRLDRLLQQIASCDMWKSLSLRSVARIQTGLNSCDISQRQNKGKRLVAATVQTRRLVAATSRRDLSHRVSRPLGKSRNLRLFSSYDIIYVGHSFRNYDRFIRGFLCRVFMFTCVTYGLYARRHFHARIHNLIWDTRL